MAFARAIVAGYKRHGKNPDQALRLAQITPTQLSQIAGRVSAQQMENLSAIAMRELDDEGLGALDRKLPWGSYGMLARASLTAPDLGTALKRWCRHHGLLTADLTLRLSTSADATGIAIEERASHGRTTTPPALRELNLVFILRNIHGLACWFIDSRIPLKAARFPFPSPPHAATYAHMFPGARPVFEAARAEIQFDTRYLTMPLRRDEKALNQMLRQRSLSIPVVPYRRDRLLAQQVRQLMTTRPEQAQSAETIAAQLHISPRTLHRQLKEEGAGLQRLKDEVRHELARELLNRGNQPVKQVAAAVGFRNEKSFIRAFRQWEGASPGEIRLGKKV